MKHPNVITLLNVINIDTRLYLVFEVMDKDLRSCLNECDEPLSQQVIRSYTYQLLKGLEYCHVRGVMHRNLNPCNILVSRDGSLKISSFALARAFVPPIRTLTHEVVHLWYRPPEILLGCKTYALPVDIWSVGTILAEMVTRRTLFRGESEIDELFKIFRLLGTPNEDVWPGVSDLQDWNANFPVWTPSPLDRFVPGLNDAGVSLFEQLLAIDPKRRLFASEALAHLYFSDAHEIK